MYYFEHYLAAGGVRQISRASILRTDGEAWVYDTLRDEILDVFPDANVTVDPDASLPDRADLLIAPVMRGYEFPFHDVIYEQLDVLDRLSRQRHRASHVMIYRARWREVEVVASARLPALIRKRRLEAMLITACRRMPVLRRLLRPRYPN
jgi:hypothetical protein